jgi:UDP-N-acetyl-D-glucosamine dehydrogenase
MEPIASQVAAGLHKAIVHRTARIGVVNSGGFGLRRVHAVAAGQFPVIAFDCNSWSATPIPNQESEFSKAAAQGIEVANHPDQLQNADIVLICMPIPLTAARSPDVASYLKTVTRLAALLRPGQLIVVETSAYLGMVRDLFVPVLEKRGFRAGNGCFLGCSVDRDKAARQMHSASPSSLVVGGIDAASAQLTATLYRTLGHPVELASSLEAAEAVRLIAASRSNVVRALINEWKMLCTGMQVNVWEVLKLAGLFRRDATQSIDDIHCMNWGEPLGPESFLLTWAARRLGLSTRLNELAGEINAAVPGQTVERIAEVLNQRCKPLKGSKILVVGLGNRHPDEFAPLPGLELLELLHRKGAEVNYHEPRSQSIQLSAVEPSIASQLLTVDIVTRQDLVIALAEGPEIDWQWVVDHSALIVDLDNLTWAVERHREKILLV